MQWRIENGKLKIKERRGAPYFNCRAVRGHIHSPSSILHFQLLRQLRQSTKRISCLLPLRQQFIENPRIGLAGGMQQHDRPVMNSRQQLGECLLIGRLVIRIPVHIRERPENRGIPQLLRLPEILLAELALRRTIKFLHRLTGQRGVFEPVKKFL